MFYKNFFLKNFILKNPDKLGIYGEWMGVDYYRKKGYELLAKNLKFKDLGEIDLILKLEKEILLVEVKTRKKVKNQFFLPEDSISNFKREKYLKMADLFKKKYNLINYHIKLKSLSIVLEENGKASFHEGDI